MQIYVIIYVHENLPVGLNKQERRMKKSLVIVISAILICILTACAEVKAEYAIGNDNKVTVSYTLKVDKKKLEGKEEYLNAGLGETQKYWEKQGMAVSKEDDGASVTLKGKREIQAKNTREAFETLKGILTGAYSPFKTLDFQYAESYMDNKYALLGTVSLEDIIRKDEGKTIPDDIVLQLKDAASASVYSVTVTLPGKIKSANCDSESEKDGLSSGTWTVQYGETKEMRLQTKYDNIANERIYEDLNKQKETYDLVLLLCLGAGAVILIALLAVLIIFIRKRSVKRTSIQV
jgi:hypothetical protein